MQTLKELYLTVFVLFFRFAKQSWSDHTNACKGAAGITLFQWTLLGSAILWISAFTGTDISGLSKLTFYILCFGSYLLNYRFLVLRGYGMEFERAFGHFEARKRRLLIIGGLVLVVLSYGVAFASAVALRPDKPALH